MKKVGRLRNLPPAELEALLRATSAGVRAAMRSWDRVTDNDRGEAHSEFLAVNKALEGT